MRCKLFEHDFPFGILGVHSVRHFGRDHFKSFSENFTGAKGPQTRVRAGPFPTRDAAERAREKLKSLGLSPVGAVALKEQP